MSALNNAKWIALIQFVKIGSQLANLFFLTRFIHPSEYGLMAMAGVATNLVLILRDLGTAAAIIQKKEISEREVRSVFSLNIIMGVVLAASTILLAPILALALNEPRLENVLLWLSVTFVMGASTAVHQALLERESKFRLIAAIEASASLIALIAAVVTALLGWGVYSLVAQAIFASLVASLGLIAHAPRTKPVIATGAELKGIFSFSGPMAGYQLTSYLFRNADSFLIGRMLGATPLGVYSLAYKLMLFPVQNVSWVTTRALFPVMSRAQGDLQEVIRLHDGSIRSVSFFVAPLMLGLAVCAKDFVAVVFSQAWAGVAPILSWLALVGYLQVMVGTTGPVLMALGKTKWLFQLAILNAVVHLGSFYAGATLAGALGLAQAYLAASMLMTPITFAVCCSVLRWSTKALFCAAAPSATGALIMCAALAGVQVFLVEASAFQRLMLSVCVGVVVYTVYSLLFQKSVLKKGLELVMGRSR